MESNEEVFGRKLLRYGKIISDQNIEDENCVRIREILLDEKRYLHYMVNGRVVDIVYLGKAQVYRFYFSQSQKELHGMFKSMGDTLEKLAKNGEIPPPSPGAEMLFFPRFVWKERYIKMPGGNEVEFTQVCTDKGEVCRYKDAVLVAELMGSKEEIFRKIHTK